MPTPINISASRGASILGLSKWSTPVQVWLQIMESREPGFCEKNNYKLPEFEDSAVLRWGKAFESAIIELASEKVGQPIKDREKSIIGIVNLMPESEFRDLDPIITCHIDGWYGSGEDEPLHEGKTTSIFYYRDNFGEPGTDRVPVEYQIQCQHQMICTDAEKVILSVLVFPTRVDTWEEMGWIPMKKEDGIWTLYFNGNEQNPLDDRTDPIQWARPLNEMGYFHQYEITANPELQQLMINAYQSYWNEYVLTGLPPDPKSYDDIRALIREPVGTIIATEEIERLQSEYKQIKSEISGTGTLAKRAEQIKVSLIDYMNKAGKVIDDDSGDKFILLDRAGKKIGQYSKNKNGHMMFR